MKEIICYETHLKVNIANNFHNVNLETNKQCGFREFLIKNTYIKCEDIQKMM